MARPSPPGSLFINGRAEESTAMVTKNIDGTLQISAIPDDPDTGQQVRIVARYTTDKNWAHYHTATGSLGLQGVRRTLTLKGLTNNTLYYLRVWSQDARGAFSATYNASSFWTDRAPDSPVLVSPPENASLDPAVANLFDWTCSDPDGDPSDRFRFEWRVAATVLAPPGPWSAFLSANNTSATEWSMPAGTLKPSSTYEWRLRNRDPQGLWGDYSLVRSLSTIGVSKPPIALSPGSNSVIYADDDQSFYWRFQDPDPLARQANADLRYRVVGTSVWITFAGSGQTSPTRVLPVGSFQPGYRYEWQVRTYRDRGSNGTSDWSLSNTFWTALTPGSLADLDLDFGEGVQGALGTGTHRVFVFDKGGVVQRGELTQMSHIEWGRKRDDISTASVTITGYSNACAQLLAGLSTWIHELVIFRDDERVWEGPITGITQKRGEVQLDAKDPMVYAYRRIMRQGYNDGYRLVAGRQMGLKTAVERAGLILTNALGYADPNVLPYLTIMRSGGDAQQSRIVPDYTKSAWEEIDDMAANAGIDYTTIGRRIMIWDTHQPLGMLPEMNDDDFTEDLIVSEYGMLTANYFAVTDGQGTWGAAIPSGLTEDNWFDAYGPLEQLASGYGDTTDAPDVIDPTALAQAKADLESQARRNVNGRWPAPKVVRVPDNSGISPAANVTINQLVPGVWIPLRVDSVVTPFSQIQKLDSLQVTEDQTKEGSVETVQVVLSPAPRGFEDPDAAQAAEGQAGSD